MKKVETVMERMIFSSRWMLAPLYVGLVLSIILLIVKFAKQFIQLVPTVFSSTDNGSLVIVGILSLIDIVLVANLMVIIIFAGYENFVSKIEVGDHEDRPNWMGHVDFSDLKIKLIGSIVAISGIELLKAFVNVQEMTQEQLMWKVIIHLTFVLSGVLFATMDWMGSRKHAAKAGHKGG